MTLEVSPARRRDVTWLVTDHGLRGSVPLLQIANGLRSERCLLVTTSLSSHLGAAVRSRPSRWIDCWRRGATTGARLDPLRHGQIELSRSANDDQSRSRAVAAIQTIEADLRRHWAEGPPSLVVLWDRRHALGSLASAMALEAGVPVVVIHDGFAANTILIDRLIDDERRMLAVRRLARPGGPEVGPVVWRRPGWVAETPIGFRALAFLGNGADYAEKALRSRLGFPSLVPWEYWSAFFRARIGASSVPDSGALPNEVGGFVLVALHTPPGGGRLADPWALARACVESLPVGRPLVICPHPGERDLGVPADVVAAIACRPGSFFIRSGTPTWQLLDRAALLVTLTSAIGLEALTRGIPTLAADGAPYVRPGLAHSFNPSTFRSAAEDPAAFRPDPDVVQAFLVTVAREQSVVGNSQAMSEEVAAQVAERVVALAAAEPGVLT